MKRTINAGILFTSLITAQTAFGVCAPPADPDIPSGGSASGAEMLKAKKAVEAYLKDIESYILCGTTNQEEKRALGNKEKVAERFNTELRTYKSRS